MAAISENFADEDELGGRTKPSRGEVRDKTLPGKDVKAILPGMQTSNIFILSFTILTSE